MIRLPEQAEVWDVTKEGSWSEELTLPAPRGEFGLPDYSRYGEEMIWEAIKLYLGGDFDFESEFFATFKPWLVKFVRAGLTLRKGRALVEEDGLRNLLG